MFNSIVFLFKVCVEAGKIWQSGSMET